MLVGRTYQRGFIGVKSMKKFSIGYRTLKSAIGAAVSIAIAEFFGLQFYASAGMLTILSVQPTKRKSLHAVYTRVVASVLGLTMTYLFFELFGYNPIAVAVMLILFIPLTVSLKVSEGVVSSIVIIMHVYMAGSFTFALLKNELALMAIGYTVGLLVNVYMPDSTRNLVTYRKRLEELYAQIFSEIAKYLRNIETLWDGHQLIEAAELLDKAKALASLDVENHLTRKENLQYVYFDMRERQLEIIERVLPKITTLPVIVQQAELVAVFMEELSEHVHSGNTASLYRDKLQQVKSDFANLPLPSDHETFLAMASLYQFIEEMDAYLAIKQSFKGIA